MNLLLALLPLTVLLVLAIAVNIRVAVFSALALTLSIYFIEGNDIMRATATSLVSLIQTIDILLIVTGALMLYEVMTQNGALHSISSSLQANIHSDGTRFAFIAFFFTLFFENLAGFGTPGAIVPPILIAMGYSAGLSLAAVLLLDSLFAITGAVGTPVLEGIKVPLDLSDAALCHVVFMAVVLLIPAALVFILYIRLLMKQEKRDFKWKPFAGLLLMYWALMLTVVQFLGALSGIFTVAVIGVASPFVFFDERKMQLKPWMPYLILVIFLLLPKVWNSAQELKAWELFNTEFSNTGIALIFKPFKTPLVPFILATAVAFWLFPGSGLSVGKIGKKLLSVFSILFPSIAIAQFMLLKGADDSSMIDNIAASLSQAGEMLPFLSVLIGVIGAFISGSTTVSNILFSSLQFEAAGVSGFGTKLILGLQLSGASLGNAVCLYNIIAAASVIGYAEHKLLFRKNILPVFIASLLVAAFSYLFLGLF